MIFVTNKNEFDHIDRYNGQDYVFPVGEAVPLDEAAAHHMLGYGTGDKTETLVRLGWATKFDEASKRTIPDPDGVEKLKKFIFSRGEFRKSDHEAEPAPEQSALIEDSPI